MMENNILAAKQAACKEIVGSYEDRTVEENIDAKIAFHESEIMKLQLSKETLKPLLRMRIGDLRNAMMF